MLITRTCIFTGQTNTLDLPVTEEQMLAYGKGQLIQKAFPNLSDDEREFILNGIMPGTFEDFVGEEQYGDDEHEYESGYDDDEDIYDFETDTPF